MIRQRHFTGLFVFFIAIAPALAQSDRIDPAGINGALLVCGKGEVSQAALERFVDLAGGAKAKIVCLAADDDKMKDRLIEGLVAAAKKKGAAEPHIAPVKDAKKALRDASGVWLMIDSDKAGQDEFARPVLGDVCLEFLKRGGVVAGAGRSPLFWGMLPGGLLETRASKEAASKVPDHLKSAFPGWIGFSIEPGAALQVKGRTISAVGDGTTVIYLAESKGLPARTITLQGKTQADLTALRRAALDRHEGFPPKTPEPPVVEKGTLVIVGGGGSPEGLYKKFIEYAGGPEKANIVIFPTAAADPLPKREVVAAAFKKAGAKKATVLYGKTQAEVESKEFLDTLKEATGIWFDGGRQWRFADCYENTKALPLMFDVLKRGGVIGGTSAGATIQGDYLCRGGVFHNFDIRYEGYERGLGFLKGVAIDQHFSKRERQSEMTALMKIYPQYLGIGIDEATAIVVKGQIADVIGKGKVFFYDAKRKVEKGQPDFEALPAGTRYDLKERKVLSAPP